MEGQLPGERPEEGGGDSRLVRDGSVAAVVITDFLHRPYVTSKVMTDDTARHAGNLTRQTGSAGKPSKPGSYARQRFRGAQRVIHGPGGGPHAVDTGLRAVQRQVVTDRRQPWRIPSRYPRSTCHSRPG
ncbi:DUF6192 family protein [Streptomyces sp. SP17KL33]|uniref:DUF6192 family protein n=1 Tax=Streptomyces sp. SP17KL33 TaxID=3002534 RepID=UPI003FCD47ED